MDTNVYEHVTQENIEVDDKVYCKRTDGTWAVSRVVFLRDSTNPQNRKLTVAVDQIEERVGGKRKKVDCVKEISMYRRDSPFPYTTHEGCMIYNPHLVLKRRRCTHTNTAILLSPISDDEGDDAELSD